MDAVNLLLAWARYPLPLYTNAVLGQIMQTPLQAEQFFAGVVVPSLRFEAWDEDMKPDLALTIFAYVLDRLGAAISALSTDIVSTNLAALLAACFCHHEVPARAHGYDLIRLLDSHTQDIPSEALSALGCYPVDRLSKEIPHDVFYYASIMDLLRASLCVAGKLSRKVRQ